MVRSDPKKRRYDFPAQVLPSIQEWKEHLDQEGKDGGCLADEVQNVIDKWRFSFLRPAKFTVDEIASERALDDFERIKDWSCTG